MDTSSAKTDGVSVTRLPQHVAVDPKKATPDDASIQSPTPPYSVMSESEKIFTIVLCSAVNFLSPVAGNMYYPALGPLARDMNVSKSTMNLTITVFKVVQGIAPLLTATIADQNGRRPVVLICLVLFLGSNIGLALQTNFAGLMVLRCAQSFGSSSGSVVANAAVADLVTRGERGKYMFYSSLGMAIGPAVGPILGGVIVQFLGWRSSFWFLAIIAGVIVLLMAMFLRETCRAVTGNGSIPPQRWNRSILQMVKVKNGPTPNHATRTVFKRRPSLLDVLKIVMHRHIGLLVLCSTLRFSGSIAVLGTLPALLERKYRYNPLQIGLCYIPFAVGGIVTRWTVGTVTDWNYRRHAQRNDVEVRPNEQQELRDIPIEKARLQITIPLMYLSSCSVLAYGCTMSYDVHIAAPLVFLFLLGNTDAGVTNTLKMLVMDLHTSRPATATAAMNSFKNLVGAGSVAAALPLINAIGIGWVGTIICFLWLLATPALWILYFKGHVWRQRQEVQVYD
ncbi:putative MFS multidrug transporter [Aspergillus affinis]|uniref:putative MFS multidrug transporter n=1 Tax=Aspergillus affinis TaxID=1070780 RepID=UPI0022FEB45B|nr:uncharacterized protein KD926_004865 [Aspergillus affinis]KAI9034970.1 hypothetical protein KD926_004865 [Aspergillus affinis]